MRTLLLCLVAVSAVNAASPAPQKSADRRLTTVRTLYDKDFFLKPPATLEAWKARRQAVREQVLVATGLWPMPPRPAIRPTIHGRIDRDGYTVEKVFFTSLPGHYVTGNLYRPRSTNGTLPKGKFAGVLCPYGHSSNGRFNETPLADAKKQVASKAEKTIEGARFPLQARCAQLARMGCVVFHYDMVGRADSTTIQHQALGGLDADLRLQSLMGLQTFNSVRALDFLFSLPEVDAKRIGVTGESGGGTQTFMLGAIDDRPAVAFPAVMVSTQMQGGCVCENCSNLRIGTGNVELAALFAPKPLAMSGADDWTIDIERLGLPELRSVYKLYGAADKVNAKCFAMFKHNYNQPAREMMYEWFNKYLNLGQPTPIHEKPFVPIPPTQLTVFDKEHPLPTDCASVAKVREYLTTTSDQQIAALRPDGTKKLDECRRLLGPALRVMTATSLPQTGDVESTPTPSVDLDGASTERGFIGRKGQGEQVPYTLVRSKNFKGTVVVWIDPAGKSSLVSGGKMVPDAKAILDAGAAILAIDALGTGELAFAKVPKVDPAFAGFTFGYNRSLLGHRVHDILTAVAVAQQQKGVTKVHLWGRGKAGPWVMLARGLTGKAVARTAADVDRFRFDRIKSANDEMMLPGALKYGGLAALAALAAPGELYLHNHRGAGLGEWLKSVYGAAEAKDKLKTSGEPVAGKDLVAWLLK